MMGNSEVGEHKNIRQYWNRKTGDAEQRRFYLFFNVSSVAGSQRQLDYFGAVRKGERLRLCGPDVAKQTSAPDMQTPMRPLRLLPWPPQSHLNYYLPAFSFPESTVGLPASWRPMINYSRQGYLCLGSSPGPDLSEIRARGVGRGRSDMLTRKNCGSVGSVSHLTQPSSQKVVSSLASLTTKNTFGYLLKDCDGALVMLDPPSNFLRTWIISHSTDTEHLFFFFF